MTIFGTVDGQEWEHIVDISQKSILAHIRDGKAVMAERVQGKVGTVFINPTAIVWWTVDS